MKQKLDYIPNDLVSLYDYERYAKERMSLNSLAYVCSAAGDELTYKSNEKLFDMNEKKAFRTDISCSLFFTDPEEYEGGEMVIEDTFGTHEVKLPAGDLILYPSTSLHRVEPVTKGVRMVSFMWIQSMIRSAWKRSILFELDNTIQSLRVNYGEIEETLNLSIHYHKLIQEWSEL